MLKFPLRMRRLKFKSKNGSEQIGRLAWKDFITTSSVRSFRLPQHLTSDQVDAKFENGILKLVLPKREETMQFGPKQVKIS